MLLLSLAGRRPWRRTRAPGACAASCAHARRCTPRPVLHCSACLNACCVSNRLTLARLTAARTVTLALPPTTADRTATSAPLVLTRQILAMQAIAAMAHAVSLRPTNFWNWAALCRMQRGALAATAPRGGETVPATAAAAPPGPAEATAEHAAGGAAPRLPGRAALWAQHHLCCRAACRVQRAYASPGAPSAADGKVRCKTRASLPAARWQQGMLRAQK